VRAVAGVLLLPSSSSASCHLLCDELHIKLRAAASAQAPLCLRLFGYSYALLQHLLLHHDVALHLSGCVLSSFRAGWGGQFSL
jgi:hypothetical protein